jgi:L-seryl-tRNA(Ser) seleniumtransferase
MPTFIMLSRTVETLDARAKDLAEKLRKKAPGFSFTVEDDVSYMGSGSLPMEDIKTRVIAVSCKKIDCDTLSQSLRMRDFPIFARIRDNKVIMDLRTILDGEEHAIIEAFEDEEKKLGKKKSKER